MVQPRETSELTFRSILTGHGDLKTGDTGVFYIGMGDHFDDDRRRVREMGSALRVAIRLTWAEASPFSESPQRKVRS